MSKALILLLCFPPALLAGVLTITTAPTFKNCGYYISYPDSTGVVCHVYYRVTTTETWYEAYSPIFAGTYPDADTTEYRGSIVGLTENTGYDIMAKVLTGEATTDSGFQTFSTWKNKPTILRTHSIGDIYTSGAMTIADSDGTDEGWIRILGDGVTVIDGGAVSNQAISIATSSYLILENLIIVGGKRHGIYITDSLSNHIRIVNCDISGWGREPVTQDESGAYRDSENDVIMLDAGIFIYKSEYDVVEQCYVHDPRGRANAYVVGQDESNGPIGLMMASRNTVIRYNDFTGSENHWLNDIVESYQVAKAGPWRDCDIEGNFFAFGNDDGLECDGPNYVAAVLCTNER